MISQKLAFKYLALLSLTILVGPQLSALAQRYDSLKAQLPLSTYPPDQLKILLELSAAGIQESAQGNEFYLDRAFDLAHTLGDTSALGSAFMLLGDNYQARQNPDSALASYIKALQLFKAIQHAENIASAAWALAKWHATHGHEREGIFYAEQAVPHFQAEGAKESLVQLYSLLGKLHVDLSEIPLAIQYCAVAMALAHANSNHDLIAEIYFTLGRAYDVMHQFSAATAHFEAGLSLEINHNTGAQLYQTASLALRDEETAAAVALLEEAIRVYTLEQNKLALAETYLALGRAHMELFHFDDAQRQLSIAYSYAEEIGDPDPMAKAQAALAFCLLQTDNPALGREYILEALDVAKQEGLLSTKSSVFRSAADFFQGIGRLDSALFYFEKYDALQASIIEKQVSSRLGETLEAYTLQLLDRENEKIAQELDRRKADQFNQRIKIYALVAAIMAIALIAGVLYSRYTVKTRATVALERQTESINKQKEEILAQRNEIVRKNRLLEDQNQQITQGIAFARDIQLSMLPEEHELRSFFPESFIFNQPKEIVSGDIFWFAQIEQKMVLAMIDCTGHGVQGAFLTVLVNNLLNQLVLEQHMTNPAEIMTKLDRKVRKSLRSETHDTLPQGIAIALMVVDADSRWLEFTGAKMPLYYVHNYSLVQIKGDRFSVGNTLAEEKFFTRQRIKLQEGDFIYLASDGFQNQFGGKDSKKFMKTQFRRLLNSLSTLPMDSQRNVLQQRFFAWKGDHAQTDDVLVVGLQL